MGWLFQIIIILIIFDYKKMSQIRQRDIDADDVLSLNEDFNEYYDELDPEEEDEVVEKRGRPRI